MFPTNNNDPFNQQQEYQVKPQDRDLLTLAANLNVPFKELKAANPDIKSISTGQYIKVPTVIKAKPGTVKVPTGSFLAGGPKNPVALGVVPNMPKINPAAISPQVAPSGNEILAQRQAQQFAGINPYQQGANSFTGAGGTKVNTVELQNNINQQIQAGQLPQVVPMGTNIINPATGKPVSSAEMVANGYVYNNYTKQYELGGTNSKPTSNNTTTNSNGDTVPAWQQNVNYNGQIMPAWKAELMYKRQNGIDTVTSYKDQVKQGIRKRTAAKERADQLARAKAQEPLRSDSPSTTLAIRLGS